MISLSYSAHTTSVRLNKYKGCNVQHGDYSQHCCMAYMKAVKRKA